MKKRLTVILSLIMVMMFATSVFAGDQLDIPMGKIVNGKSMIPLRGAFEDLGFEVTWDSATNTATLEDDYHVIVVKKNDPNFTVDGVSYVSEVAPQIINGSMYIPLRALGDKIGAETIWNDATRVASIEYNGEITYIVLKVAENITAPRTQDTVDVIEDMIEIQKMFNEYFLEATSDLSDTEYSIALLEEIKKQAVEYKNTEDSRLTPSLKQNLNGFTDNLIISCDLAIEALNLMDTDPELAFEKFDLAVRYAYVSDVYFQALIDFYIAL